MEMVGTNSADEETNAKTTKLLSEIRSIVRLQTSLSQTFQSMDAGESVENCDAERDQLKERLEIFISEMAADCKQDRHVARRCRSIVNTVSGVCYPNSARNVVDGKYRAVQPTTGQGSFSVESKRDTHAVVGRRADVQKAVSTEGRTAGGNGRRQDDVHEEKCSGRGRRPEGTGETRPVSGSRLVGTRGQNVYRAVRVSTVVEDEEDIAVSTPGKMPEKSKTDNAETMVLCNNSQVLKRGMVDEKTVTMSTSVINDGTSTKPFPKDLAKQSKEKPVQNYNRFRATNMATGNRDAVGKSNMFIKTTKPCSKHC